MNNRQAIEGGEVERSREGESRRDKTGEESEDTTKACGEERGSASFKSYCSVYL